MAGFWGWAVAQVAKVFTHYIKKGKWDVSQLVASGGMPSSHSSLCMVRTAHPPVSLCYTVHATTRPCHKLTLGHQP